MAPSPLDDLHKERTRKRLENINAHVSLLTVAIDLGVIQKELTYGGDFQLKCPFHGQDNKPSAHIYAKGSFFCFTCKRNYDAVGFVVNYKKIPFRSACSWLETTYGIKKLDTYDDTVPEEYAGKYEVKNGVETTQVEDYDGKYRIIENKIIKVKRQLGLETYARALLALDLTKEAKNFAQLLLLEQKLTEKVASF